jgi:SAM-dependent methyltransferase
MRFHTDPLVALHQVRRSTIQALFASCPDRVFADALELGAGDGYQSTLLSRYAGRLVSTDYSPRILARQGTDRVQYRVCDAERVGECFAERSFDLVFSSHLLEHLPRVDRALAGIRDVLRDDGVTVHVMPSVFWKVCQLGLQLPDNLLRAIELASDGGRRHELRERIRTFGSQERAGSAGATWGEDPNPKLARPRTPTPYLQRLLVPEIHGVEDGHWAELAAFSRRRWIAQLERAGFQVVAVLRGAVYSGYAFGFERGRQLLERLGFTSEYAYVALKAGHSSPHLRRFVSASADGSVSPAAARWRVGAKPGAWRPRRDASQASIHSRLLNSV